VSLGSEVFQKQGIHRPLETDVKLSDLPFRQRDNRHAGEAQLFEQGCHVRLIAADAIEGFGKHDIERAALRVQQRACMPGRRIMLAPDIPASL
jgi:hypothetical protein